MTRITRRRRRTGLIAGSLVAAAGVPGSAGCSSPQTPISIGMTSSEVRARLGAPERIGVLHGKDIDTIAPEAETRAEGRIVYFYRDGRLAIWFERARVTGVTDTTDSTGAGDRQQEDH